MDGLKATVALTIECGKVIGSLDDGTTTTFLKAPKDEIRKNGRR